LKSYMGEGTYGIDGTHVIEVVLQSGENKATVYYEMGGNCTGVSIISAILSGFEDGDFEPNMLYESNKKHILLDEDGYVRDYILFDDSGEELLIDGNEIAGNVVSVSIIDFKFRD
jgi:hypothetical protein